MRFILRVRRGLHLQCLFHAVPRGDTVYVQRVAAAVRGQYGAALIGKRDLYILHGLLGGGVADGEAQLKLLAREEAAAFLNLQLGRLYGIGFDDDLGRGGDGSAVLVRQRAGSAVYNRNEYRERGGSFASWRNYIRPR
jgi:hypothetical protein